MAYPNTPVQLFSFTGFSVASPTSPLPGTSLDTEFGEVRRAASETVAFLEGSHLDSAGLLKSLTVNLAQLDATLVQAIFGTAVPDLSAYEITIGVARDAAVTAQGAAETAQTAAELAETNAETAETNAGVSATASAASAVAAALNSGFQANDTTGSGGAYLVTTPAALTSLVDGHLTVAIANHANAGPATINVDGTGVVSWKKLVAGVVTPLVTGDILTGVHYLTAYDASASAWICTNPGGGSGADGIIADSGGLYTATDIEGALQEVHSGKQPLDADLTALAGLTSAANKIPMFTGSGAATLIDRLDEDTMSSNSATAVATQQSIKAYVDTNTSVITRGTPVATTSGTAKGFTGLPSGLNRITFMLDGVSIGGTDQLIIRIGDSGGYETTGYTSEVESVGVDLGATNGFIITRNLTAAAVYSGFITFNRVAGNTWLSGGKLVGTSLAEFCKSGGTKTLSGTLDRIQITNTAGWNFDAGQINIIHE